jgi:nucleoside-diphosphate-sugar epimerase
MTTHKQLHVILGTGALGQSVMRELLTHNVQIRMVNRSGKGMVPKGVELVAANAYNPELVVAVTQGATVVYQCAQPDYTQWPTLFPKLQDSIVQGVATNGAKLIVGDNLYMYGPVKGAMHEDLPNAATTRKGRTRAQMTEALLKAHEQGLIQVAIARGSDFYGSGVLNSAMGDRIFPAVLAGKAAEGIGNLDALHTYTFIDDFGKALVILGKYEKALGQIWHVPNAETVSTRQFLTIAFQQAGYPPKMNETGKLMMRLGGLFIAGARETVEMMYEFEEPFVVNHNKYVQAFGNHSTPLETGIARTLAWYSEHLKQKK